MREREARRVRQTWHVGIDGECFGQPNFWTKCPEKRRLPARSATDYERLAVTGAARSHLTRLLRTVEAEPLMRV
jgi:hypothetical protein